MADELQLLAIRWIFVRETWSQVSYDWLNGLIYSYAYVSVVLTSEISDITISISTRRTKDFDNLVLMLMSRLSSLRHKTRYICFCLCLCLCRSEDQALKTRICFTLQKPEMCAGSMGRLQKAEKLKNRIATFETIVKLYFLTSPPVQSACVFLEIFNLLRDNNCGLLKAQVFGERSRVFVLNSF